MTSLPAKIAALALIVALCALRCSCGCMADSLGAYLGHAAAPEHACHHCGDDQAPSPAAPDRSHDRTCSADDRIPSPAATDLRFVETFAATIEFPQPIAAIPPPPRPLDAPTRTHLEDASTLLRLHCALIV